MTPSLSSITGKIANGVTVAHNDLAWGNPATGRVTNVPADSLVFLGYFDLGTSTSGATGNAGGTVTARVDFDRSVHGRYIKNATVSPATVFAVAYSNASKEATSDNTLDTPFGLCIEVDSRLGAFVASNF